MRGREPISYDELDRRLWERKQRRMSSAGDLSEVAHAIIVAAFDQPARLHVTTRPLPDDELARSIAAADQRVGALLHELDLHVEGT